MLLSCRRAVFLFPILLLIASALSTRAEPIRQITIDGNFSDWAVVPPHFDPVGGPGVLHNGIPDTHDTDHSNSNDVPAYVSHPDIDIVEYKFAHDASNLYAYFRATGIIGHTISNATQHGRYYVIVTLDVDNSTATGYGLHEGGYYPTSYGYDMNMEVEYYNGAFNTGHYINHGARNSTELSAATKDQTNGIVRILPGTYDFYTQWVWFDDATNGTYRLPAPDTNSSITFVADRGPVYQGITRIALSPDGHEAEMVAPFRGFMRNTNSAPIMALRKTLNLSFSLEASGELAPGNSWASDTGDPIVGYYLSPYPDPKLKIERGPAPDAIKLSWASGATGMRLERSPKVSSGPWQPIAGAEVTNRMTLAIEAGPVFFRLVE